MKGGGGGGGNTEVLPVGGWRDRKRGRGGRGVRWVVGEARWLAEDEEEGWADVLPLGAGSSH